MQRNIGNLLSAVALFGILLLSSCSTVGTRVSTAQYPFLVHPDRQDSVAWRKVTGPDFDVFYGQPKTNKNASFGFYRGGHPDSHPVAGSRAFSGRLGAFAVEWNEEALPDGQVYRSAVFDRSARIVKLKNHNQEFRFIEKVHIWVSGADEHELERWIDYLGGLELFRMRPEDKIEVR